MLMTELIIVGLLANNRIRMAVDWRVFQLWRVYRPEPSV
jgi:hypothetical protein